jgi:hypothetical protein
MTISEICLTKSESDTALLLEGTLGHIRGKVVDIRGTAIMGCTICIRETDDISYTDENGNFTMINIVPSVYTITVECNGYSPCIFFKAPIKMGDNPGFRFVLHLFE